MLALSFKQKLVASMMLVVGGITIAILVIAERKLQQAYELQFQQEFNSAFTLFTSRQEARLAAVRSIITDLSTSVRVIAFLDSMSNEPDPEAVKPLYDTIGQQIEVQGGDIPVEFFYAYDAAGRLISREEDEREAFRTRQLERIHQAVTSGPVLDVGYVELEELERDRTLYQILVSKCTDPNDEKTKGTLLFGMMLKPDERTSAAVQGLWVEGKLRVSGVSDQAQGAIKDGLENGLTGSGQAQIRMDSQPCLLSYRSLMSNHQFPPAYLVAVQPLEPLRVAKRELRTNIALAGALAMAVALGLSLVLAGGLTAPINCLVEGAHQVERGNFNIALPIRTRDEVGRLTQSFNEMAAGLQLREKYRSVLDMVSDKKIAHDLIHGQIELGGEEREVSVLFCDIRGFTPLTEHMEPREVIEMLNEHFTPLTRIVHEHNGAVDKFVGDLIMAIFGAPKAFGHDVENAARCALRMVEERMRLNETGKYQINIGIGVASGKVVAGRMGSKDRLNYTVLGPRVNLAARLCSKAGKNEVVVDDETWQRVEEFAEAESMPQLQLKGFATAVQAYKLRTISNLNETKTSDVVAV